MTARRLFAFGTIAASIACASLARAEATPSEAEQRVAEGTALYESGSYEAALSKFVQACALAKAEPCSRYIALTELKLGRFVEGQRDLAAYVARFPPADPKPYDDLMKDAYAKTGHLKVKAPDGSQIVIDSGEPVGTTPLAVEVPVTAGKHTVLAKRKGVSFGRDVDAPAGKVIVVDLANGEDDEDEDDAAKPVKPKPKTEKVRATGAWIGGGIIAGLGVVGLGFGIGAAVASQNAKDDVRRLYALGVCAAPSTACNAYRDAVDSLNTASALSVTGYVTGGVLLATGFLVWIMWPKAERPILTPAVSPSSLGLSLTGTF